MVKKSLEDKDTELALIAQDISYIKSDIGSIKAQLNSSVATKDWVNSEYGQTRKILNAILVTMGTVIVAAFATFVIRGGLR
jgi:hypothetical protein